MTSEANPMHTSSRLFIVTPVTNKADVPLLPIVGSQMNYYAGDSQYASTTRTTANDRACDFVQTYTADQIR